MGWMMFCALFSVIDSNYNMKLTQNRMFMMTSKYFMNFAQLDRPIFNFSKINFVFWDVQNCVFVVFILFWYEADTPNKYSTLQVVDEKHTRCVFDLCAQRDKKLYFYAISGAKRIPVLLKIKTVINQLLQVSQKMRFAIIFSISNDIP